MPDISEAVRWIKSKIPALLRNAFGGGIAILSLLAALIEVSYGFGFVHVFRSTEFMAGMTAVLWWWFAVLIRNWRAPSIRRFRYLGALFLILCSLLTFAGAIRQSEFRFNQMGFYESRQWHLVADSREERKYSKEIIAVGDLTNKPFRVVASLDSECSEATITDFDLKLQGDGSYRPQVMDDTKLERSRESRRWRINGLQPPTRLKLSVTIHNQGRWPGTCFRYLTEWSDQ